MQNAASKIIFFVSFWITKKCRFSDRENNCAISSILMMPSKHSSSPEHVTTLLVRLLLLVQTSQSLFWSLQKQQYVSLGQESSCTSSLPKSGRRSNLEIFMRVQKNSNH